MLRNVCVYPYASRRWREEAFCSEGNKGQVSVTSSIIGNDMFMSSGKQPLELECHMIKHLKLILSKWKPFLSKGPTPPSHTLPLLSLGTGDLKKSHGGVREAVSGLSLVVRRGFPKMIINRAIISFQARLCLQGIKKRLPLLLSEAIHVQWARFSRLLKLQGVSILGLDMNWREESFGNPDIWNCQTSELLYGILL